MITRQRKIKNILLLAVTATALSSLIIGNCFNDEINSLLAVGNFKNHALSSCIAGGFTTKEIKSDASASARGYLELGEYPLEAHTEATLLARQYLKNKYENISGSNLILMKCIDFYHSKDLDLLVKKYQQTK